MILKLWRLARYLLELPRIAVKLARAWRASRRRAAGLEKWAAAYMAARPEPAPLCLECLRLRRRSFPSILSPTRK